MPTLTVTNGYRKDLPGLGSIQAFAALSQKRVTKSAREALRQKYGQLAVEVSCTAEFDGTGWMGTCKINGDPHRYRISIQ
jgi:hypothetical protein